MRHTFNQVLAGTLLALISFFGFGVVNATENSASVKALDCVRWTKEARLVGVAFNHLVHLHNQCKHAVRCEVTTNANPQPSRADLLPDAKKTVLTFRGSPARDFKVKVICKAR
ncbi:MAG: hypothetical protein GY854_08965 [Deltaproteobacteria bacterium]|nr:hypothetical protein [Deltaproteobacteria bacterium]